MSYILHHPTKGYVMRNLKYGAKEKALRIYHRSSALFYAEDVLKDDKIEIIDLDKINQQ